MIGARVRITLRDSVLDPQGEVVTRSLRTLGYDNVSHVRVGRLVELVVNETDADVARREIDAMCQQLLANPVIESYDVDLVDAAEIAHVEAATL
jgi:phosphoribosylformylglycinamidine synthase subunit PurS